MSRIKKLKFQIELALVMALLASSNTAFAQDFYHDAPRSSESFIFQLLTGGFGTFIIIFFGFGGLGSLFLTRSGNSSKKTPILGVVMLLLAGVTFGYRVAIRAGLMGHEYIQW